MGIEPTSHDSRRSSTGFEDQAHHQTGRASSWAPARLQGYLNCSNLETALPQKHVHFLFIACGTSS